MSKFKFKRSGISPAELAKRIKQVSMQEAALVISETTLDNIAEGFSGSHAPDGTPWPDLVLRDGNPLEDTGGLRDGWQRGDVSAGQAEVENLKDYAEAHQRGTGVYGPKRKRIRPVKSFALRVPTKSGPMFFTSVKGTPRRKMVPDPNEPIPKAWKEAYDGAVQEYLDEILN